MKICWEAGEVHYQEALASVCEGEAGEAGLAEGVLESLACWGVGEGAAKGQSS